MTEHQERHFQRKLMAILKKELLNTQRFRRMGIRLLWYPDPARLPL